MKTVRQRILEYIAIKKVASASEIARALKMSAANARRHINILLEEGALVVLGESDLNQPGRPKRLYGIAQSANEHNLDKLSGALLADILADLAHEERLAFLQRIAHRLSRAASPEKRPASQRLVQAIQNLNEMHYQARWEAHASAPRIILSHCPYADILPDHPELCQMDSFLLEEMLKNPVEQVARLEKNNQGLRQCVFSLKK